MDQRFDGVPNSNIHENDPKVLLLATPQCEIDLKVVTDNIQHRFKEFGNSNVSLKTTSTQMRIRTKMLCEKVRYAVYK